MKGYYFENNLFTWVRNETETITLLLCLKQLGYSKDIGQLIARYLYDAVTDVRDGILKIISSTGIHVNTMQQKLIDEKLTEKCTIFKIARRAGTSTILAYAMIAKALQKNDTTVGILCNSSTIRLNAYTSFENTLLHMFDQTDLCVKMSNKEYIHLVIPRYGINFFFINIFQFYNSKKLPECEYYLLEDANHLDPHWVINYIFPKLKKQECDITLTYCPDFNDNDVLIEGLVKMFKSIDLSI